MNYKHSESFCWRLLVRDPCHEFQLVYLIRVLGKKKNKKEESRGIEWVGGGGGGGAVEVPSLCQQV